MPTFGSLFAGIGGMDLGLERAGWEPRWQVEIDPWCQRVLEKHWPDVPRYGDVRDVHELESVDLICGGFPCQPVSLAGRRRAQDDERWLWPEFARIVHLVRPRYVVVENVPGLLAHGMGDVLGDLAGGGYDAEWDCIPASAVGAPHLRYRVFVVAYRSDLRRGTSSQEGESIGDSGIARMEPGECGAGRGNGHPDADLAHPQVFSERPGLCACGAIGLGRRRSGDGSCTHLAWATEPDVGRVANGVPSRVDRLRGLGNAVVPQVAEYIGRRLMEVAS